MPAINGASASNQEALSSLDCDCCQTPGGCNCKVDLHIAGIAAAFRAVE